MHLSQGISLSDCIVFLTGFVAAITDTLYGRVYNKLTYPTAAIGIALSLVLRSPNFYQSIAGLVASFLLYLLVQKLAGLGGGDVKLMAAVGALKGFPFVLFATFYILCAGSILGIIVLASRGRLFSATRWVFSTLIASSIPGFARPQLEGGGTLMPFAPAIFIGTAYSIYLEVTRGQFSLSWWF